MTGDMVTCDWCHGSVAMFEGWTVCTFLETMSCELRSVARKAERQRYPSLPMVASRNHSSSEKRTRDKVLDRIRGEIPRYQ